MSDVALPTKRSRKPRVLSPSQARLSELTHREKALAARSLVRKRVQVSLTIDEYESIILEAEKWNEKVQTVVRACVRKGLEHFARFGTEDRSPYAEGEFNLRNQYKIDPTGLAWPPTQVDIPVMPTTWTQPEMPPVGRYSMTNIPAGLLPSGATISNATAEPTEVAPTIPEQALLEIE